MNKPLFAFVHVTDAHITATHDYWTPLIASLHEERFHPRPDMIISTGDQVNGKAGDPEVLERETSLLARCLARTDIPVLTALGNHDYVGEELPGVTYQRHFPGYEFFYTRELVPGFLGVFMAWRGNEEGRAVMFEDKLGWLDRVLDSAQGRQVLLFSHSPLLPPRKLVPPDKIHQLSGPPWAAGTWAHPEEWQAYYYAMSEEEGWPFRERIARHGRVIHYAGHSHVHAHIAEPGMHHVVTSALCSEPWEYRYVQVFADRIEHRCIQPSPPGQVVHFYPGCVDEGHPTVESYHGGTEDERTFTIPLSPPSVRCPGGCRTSCA